MGEKNEQKKKPFWKKWWFWVIIVIVLGVGAISGGSQDNGEGKKSAETMKTAENDTKEDKGSDVPEPAKEEDDSKTKKEPSEIIKPGPQEPEEPDANQEETEDDDAIPTEYKSALRSAESYSELMHMSKAAIFDQLTSEYADKFTDEAAQYAVDNLEATH